MRCFSRCALQRSYRAERNSIGIQSEVHRSVDLDVAARHGRTIDDGRSETWIFVHGSVGVELFLSRGKSRSRSGLYPREADRDVDGRSGLLIDQSNGRVRSSGSDGRLRDDGLTGDVLRDAGSSAGRIDDDDWYLRVRRGGDGVDIIVDHSYSCGCIHLSAEAWCVGVDTVKVRLMDSVELRSPRRLRR